MSHKPFKSFFTSHGIVGTPAAVPPEGSASGAPNSGANASAVAAPPRLRRIVLGFEKRPGDKVVTTLSEVPVEARAAVIADLRKKFGTGGSIVEDKLVIQGDHRVALTAHFEAQGVRVAGERRA
jgi:translation initiation factor 1 (eIF-1/SUI1)